MTQKAIFIDKDGCLIEDVPYNVNPELITLYDGAGETLKQLKQKGYHLIVISNQSGVAKGFFKEDQLQNVWNKIQQLLSEFDVHIDAFYYCPHQDEDNCTCRKPKPGLFHTAIKEHCIDPAQSWMIGDILNDIEAAHRAHVKGILLDNGNETEWVKGEYREPNHVITSWHEILNIIY